jgi:transposase-like protein
MPESSLQKYFDYYKTEDKGEVKGKQMGRCRICNKNFARIRGTTGSITYHLMGTHEEFYKLYDDAKKKLDLKPKRFLQGASSGNL